MAKTLGLRIPAGRDNPDSVDEAVMNPVASTGTLGMIVASILAASSDAMQVVVDIATRTVYAAPAAGNPFDVVRTGAAVLGVLARDEDARTSAYHRPTSAGFGITNPAGMTALETLVAKPVKQSYSITSLVSKIEDAVIAKDAAVPVDVLGIGADRALILVDQDAATVTVAKAGAGDVDVAPAALAALAEIAYEQIPAAEAAGAASLAFE